MQEQARTAKTVVSGWVLWGVPGLVVLLGLAAWQPQLTASTLTYVGESLLRIAPIVIPGVILSAWVNASGAGGRVTRLLEANRAIAIVTASAVGAVTPVCGAAVLPLMTGLLSAGVPLAPVMAFWLSSPVTDPAMFAVTATTLGTAFAIGKTVAAFGIGLFGGAVAFLLSGSTWTQNPLRRNGLVSVPGSGCASPAGFDLAIWRDRECRGRFAREVWAMSRLVAICLGLAFAAEHLLQQWLQPQALATYVGHDSRWAVPLAVFVGAPAYLDGYAALPLTRGLMDLGMSPAAAMAFLVSGSVVSIWGAMAIFPVLRLKPFLLFLMLAVAGSLAAGWSYGLLYGDGTTILSDGL